MRTCNGSLCAGCTADVRRSMLFHPWRCTQCALALPGPGPCPDCAGSSPLIRRTVAAFDYLPPADSLVLRYKNAHRFYLATCFATLAWANILPDRHAWPAQAPLIPIPGRDASLKRRGFNPAGEFANQLARLMRQPVLHSVLFREPESAKQSALGRRQRQANAAHLYYCGRNLPLPDAILVDDILTTGSTLHAAALALQAAGVAEIYAIVIARTPNLGAR